MSLKPPLKDRYMTDPFFHALVHLNKTGWADENGVPHEGPTIADAQRVERFLNQIESLGFRVVPLGEV